MLRMVLRDAPVQDPELFSRHGVQQVFLALRVVSVVFVSEMIILRMSAQDCRTQDPESLC